MSTRDYYNEIANVQKAVHERELHRLEIEKEMLFKSQLRDKKYERIKNQLDLIEEQIVKYEATSARKVNSLVARIQSLRKEHDQLAEYTDKLRQRKKQHVMNYVVSSMNTITTRMPNKQTAHMTTQTDIVTTMPTLLPPKSQQEIPRPTNKDYKVVSPLNYDQFLRDNYHMCTDKSLKYTRPVYGYNSDGKQYVDIQQRNKQQNNVLYNNHFENPEEQNISTTMYAQTTHGNETNGADYNHSSYKEHCRNDELNRNTANFINYYEEYNSSIESNRNAAQYNDPSYRENCRNDVPGRNADQCNSSYEENSRNSALNRNASQYNNSSDPSYDKHQEYNEPVRNVSQYNNPSCEEHQRSNEPSCNDAQYKNDSYKENQQNNESNGSTAQNNDHSSEEHYITHKVPIKTETKCIEDNSVENYYASRRSSKTVVKGSDNISEESSKLFSDNGCNTLSDNHQQNKVSSSSLGDNLDIKPKLEIQNHHSSSMNSYLQNNSNHNLVDDLEINKHSSDQNLHVEIDKDAKEQLQQEISLEPDNQESVSQRSQKSDDDLKSPFETEGQIHKNDKEQLSTISNSREVKTDRMSSVDKPISKSNQEQDVSKPKALKDIRRKSSVLINSTTLVSLPSKKDLLQPDSDDDFFDTQIPAGKSQAESDSYLKMIGSVSEQKDITQDSYEKMKSENPLFTQRPPTSDSDSNDSVEAKIQLHFKKTQENCKVEHTKEDKKEDVNKVDCKDSFNPKKATNGVDLAASTNPLDARYSSNKLHFTKSNAVKLSLDSDSETYSVSGDVGGNEDDDDDFGF